MTPLRSYEIRKKFLDFFIKKHHLLVPSASLVPINDASLLWINSGVAALKPFFDGREIPPQKRLVNCQKALRTNDIQNVGYTTRHHTFFEMLGNFAIGDYFKKEAILLAWEFLTSKTWLGIESRHLYVTVFKDDQDAIKIWKDVIGLTSERIILGDRDTNFWDMGQGPCGPNTEIFYDRGLEYDPNNIGLKLLQDNIENDRYLEIWNIVFSQFNNDGNGQYHDLPLKNIDTGAGLERITCILQAKNNNFETDLFLPIILKCQEWSQYTYVIRNFKDEIDSSQTKYNIAFQVISDHIRAICFAISDGVFPSNKERGYVIRRLIRRAMVFGHQLGINEPFLHQLVATVVDLMKDFYPNLIEKQDIITETIKKEEANFVNNLKHGFKLLTDILEKNQIITAETTFKLYDTFGFPIELTIEIAQQQNIKIDFTKVQELLKAQQQTSRRDRQQQNIVMMDEQNKTLLECQIPSAFCGYEKATNETAKVVALFANNEYLTSVSNQFVDIILDITPFYAEKGGQASDSGWIKNESGSGEVMAVKIAPHKQHLHSVKWEGVLKINDIVCASINRAHRELTMKNHSGTHLLHAAIRSVLGTAAMQIGSFNNHDYLRLDIAYHQAITDHQIEEINKLVTQWIQQNDQCEIIYTSYAAALKMQALAFFNEKYDNEVRVVKFSDYSIELCGGTHVNSTKDIEQLLITKITSKGAGTYRFHALTATNTIQKYYLEQITILKNQITNEFNKYNPTLLKSDSLETLMTKIKNLTGPNEVIYKNLKILAPQWESNFKIWTQKQATITINEEVNKYQNLKITEFKNYKLLIYHFVEKSAAVLRLIAQKYLTIHDEIIIIFTNQNDQKHSLLVTISDDLLTKNYSALAILNSLLASCHGKGGGNKKMAVGGYQNHDNFLSLLQNLSKVVKLWNI